MDLTTYLAQLEAEAELKVITNTIDCKFEIAQYCREEFSRADGKALFFQRPKGFGIPVVGNLFGSEKRLCRLLHSHSFADFTEKIQSYLEKDDVGPAGTDPDMLVIEDLNLNLVEQVDLYQLPAIQSWPDELDPYLTLALSVTKDPETQISNIGLYRAQIKSSETLAINISSTSDAGRHLSVAAERGEILSISLVLGADPILIWAAAAPLPRNCSEMAFCRQALGCDIHLTHGLSHDVAVPYGAEIVIEGYIDPKKTTLEGPFGNHSGCYVNRQDCPLMHVTAIRQRKKPLMPITVVGPPPSENIWLAAAGEILIKAVLLKTYPQIIDLYMPRETIYHGCAFISVIPQSRRANRELLHHLWQDGPLSRSRLLVLVDRDIDVSLLSQCWWRLVNGLKPEYVYHNESRTAIDATGFTRTIR